MSDAIHLRIAPPVEWSEDRQTHPAVVQACLATSSDEPEIIWEAPTADEWRRAVRLIAKQVLLHIGGYVDDDEVARDGCGFAWDVVETLRLPTRRLH